MKKIIVALLIAVINFNAQAQMQVGNVTLDFGPKITAKKGEVTYIAGEKKGIVYTLARQKKMFYVQTFESGSNKFIKSKQIKFDKINGNKVTIEDLAIIDGEVFLFGSYYDKKAKQSVFAAYSIDEKLILGKPETVLAVTVPKRSQQGAFFFEPSYDGVNYLVMHVGIFERDEKLRYEIALLDKNLTAVHNEAVDLQFKDRKDLEFSLDDFEVNDKGDIFIVVSDSYRNKSKKTTETNLTVHTYYASKGYAKEDIKIDLKGKKVLNCNVINTADGRLQLIGFYSNLRKSGRASWKLEGIFDVALSTTDNSIVKETFNEFSVETKTKLIGERRAKKGKDLKPFYRITHLIERADGGVIVLSEWYTTFVGNTSGIGPLAFTPITYSTNEIIVTALNKNGTMDWSNVVPKEQQVTVTQFSIGLLGGASNGSVSVGVGALFPLAILGEGPEYLSSVPIYENGKLSILVNDDPKNIGTTDIDDVKKVRNIKKMIPVMFTFDDTTGKMERLDPTDYEKNQLVVRPSVTYQKGAGKYLIYGSNKEGANLGTLTITQ